MGNGTGSNTWLPCFERDEADYTGVQALIAASKQVSYLQATILVTLAWHRFTISIVKYRKKSKIRCLTSNNSWQQEHLKPATILVASR